MTTERISDFWLVGLSVFYPYLLSGSLRSALLEDHFRVADLQGWQMIPSKKRAITCYNLITMF